MWRDPMDELIEDLEKVVPVAKGTTTSFYEMELAELQAVVDAATRQEPWPMPPTTSAPSGVSVTPGSWPSPRTPPDEEVDPAT